MMLPMVLGMASPKTDWPADDFYCVGYRSGRLPWTGYFIRLIGRTHSRGLYRWHNERRFLVEHIYNHKLV